MSGLMQLLDRPIAYQPAFVRLGVGITGAVLLSQLVYWHNRVEKDWFYKTQKEITEETGLTRSETETARKKLISVGAISEELRGVPAKLYFKVKADKLEALLLLGQGGSQFAGITQTRKRKSRKLECVNPANKNAEIQQPSLQEPCKPVSVNPANIHTVYYTENTTEIKRSSCPDVSQPDPLTDDKEFLSRHPEAVVYSAKKRQWGSQEDLTCAKWIWGKIIRLYEQAAETDGELVRPKEPNWTAWSNEIRLMCAQDGRTHKQICELFRRANRDPFWCKNILSPSKLREKWDDLSLKLSVMPSHREEGEVIGGHWNSPEGWETVL